MIKLASENLRVEKVELLKTDGTGLPLPDNVVDLALSVTVLQHNTDPEMFKLYLEEMCRVSRDKVILFERTETIENGDELNIGRSVSTFANIMEKKGFRLINTEYLKIHASYYVCGAIRKIFNPKSRIEREPLTNFSLLLEKLTLPVTSVIDRFWIQKREVTKMEFQKIKP